MLPFPPRPASSENGVVGGQEEKGLWWWFQPPQNLQLASSVAALTWLLLQLPLERQNHLQKLAHLDRQPPTCLPYQLPRLTVILTGPMRCFRRLLAAPRSALHSSPKHTEASLPCSLQWQLLAGYPAELLLWQMLLLQLLPLISLTLLLRQQLLLRYEHLPAE